MRTRTIALLLRLYPAKWRAEYGQELESILSARPVTWAVIADAIWSATVERARTAEPWAWAGAVLLTANLCAFTINSVAPIPVGRYNAYESLTYVPLIAGICWTAARGAGLGRTIAVAGRIIALGLVPDLVTLLLWVCGVVHPRIIGFAGMAGADHGVALLAFRSTLPRQMRPAELVWQYPVFMLMLAAGNACVWWTIVRAVRFTVTRLRRGGGRALS
jgi:hypothetical protein